MMRNGSHLPLEGAAPGHGRTPRLMAWTAGALALTALAGGFGVYSWNANRRQPQSAQQSVSGVPLEGADYEYILRAEGGRLAVYRRGEDQPRMVYDAPVGVLPEVDQRQLQEGIYIDDYQTLVKRIEDYIS